MYKNIPSNLLPYVFKCSTCGTLVKYHDPTKSFYIIKMSKAGYKNCKFCYELSKNSIPELIDLKVK